MLNKIKELFRGSRLVTDNNAFIFTMGIITTILTIIAIIIGIIIVLWIITNPPVLIALVVLVVVAIIAKKYLFVVKVATEGG